MIPQDIIKKVRAIEIKSRKVVNTTFAGDYHSVFKGRGISFSEVREYQIGDEVRLIDWRVTARTGIPHIKLFEEERELVVMLLVDVSGSGCFGSHSQSKLQVMAEVAAVLGFSAIRNQDRVGLILFSDRVEAYIPPKKGKNHILRILRDIYYHKPEGKGTRMEVSLDRLLNMVKKQAIVFVISDFMDTTYQSKMRLVARRHDLVPIVVYDPRERSLPAAGILQLEDEETGEQLIINSNSKEVREKFEAIVLAQIMEQDRFFRSMGVMPISIDITASYVKPLRQYFEKRALKN